MWAQMAKRVVSWETRSYFFFLLYGIQWNSADQNGGIHVLFGYKSLKHRGGIHWNQGILAKSEAFGLQLRQNPWFQWNHHGFQAFNPKTRETAILIGRVSLNTVQKKKKYERVSHETTLLAIFAHILALNSNNFSTVGFKKIWAILRTP